MAISLPNSSLPSAAYIDLVRRKRLYGSVLLVVFVMLMISGWQVAQTRNAGDFLPGLSQIADFPSEVLAEAWAHRAEVPALVAKFLPSLVETLNIAAVATLTGALAAMGFALLSTRGLALWPRAVPVFRRMMDALRAVPEIVVAMVLIFLLSGGPVPAVIAIALHTTAAQVAVSKAHGATFAEFPTTVEAAQACRDNGIAVMMGAPNLIRGGSHSGNVAAADLAAADLLDIVSSDYVPAALLSAALLLGDLWGDVARGIATVTTAPARVTGLTDRGRLIPGLRADIIRAHRINRTATLRGVWVKGARVA